MEQKQKYLTFIFDADILDIQIFFWVVDSHFLKFLKLK